MDTGSDASKCEGLYNTDTCKNLLLMLISVEETEISLGLFQVNYCKIDKFVLRWLRMSPVASKVSGKSGFPFNLAKIFAGGRLKKPVKAFKRPLCGIPITICSRSPGNFQDTVNNISNYTHIPKAHSLRNSRKNAITLSAPSPPYRFTLTNLCPIKLSKACDFKRSVASVIFVTLSSSSAI